MALLTSLAPLAQAVPPPDDPQRTLTAWVLAILLVGVAVVGLLMLAMVIIWGGKLRRENRQPLPDTPEPDPYAPMRSETRRNRRGDRSDDEAAAFEDDEFL